ncbi:MAG: GAF domain-containing sensor histidine kinase [Candidatus Promineifilaceae bacterium]
MAEITPEITEAIDAWSLRQLLEISATLSSTLDLNQLLLMVIDTVTDLTDTEAAAMLLVDRGTGELQLAAATGMQTPVEEMVVPMEGSFAGWIIQNGRPLILNDVQREGRYYATIDETTRFTTRDMLGVPLVTRGQVIGALEAINKRNGKGYTEQDVVLMQSLASQAAVAIENARLFQQTDWIAELMHEIKTPLLAITTASELLARQSSPAEQELVDMIQKQTNRLSKLTRDFLELSRLESGRVHLALETVDLPKLVGEVVELEASRAAKKQVTIRTEIAADLPPVRVDPARLQQVMINLLSNAIKYNQAGGHVTIRVSIEDANTLIEVSDTGRGIEPGNLAHLFDRFYRVPASEGSSEGTGLGLPIAKEIIEAHHGRIKVISQPGEGSTFSCCIPLNK